MNKMKKEQLNKKIVSSYEACTPDVLDKIKMACSMEQQEDVMIPFGTEKKKIRRYIVPQLVVAAASLFLAFSFGLNTGKQLFQKTTHTLESVPEGTQEVTVVPETIATIYLDVNPSISITMDETRKVLDCKAENEDAGAVLKDMDLSGVDIKIALRAIVGTLYMHGYLQGNTDAMLVSIDTKEDSILTEISQDVHLIFRDCFLESETIIQQVEGENYKELAELNHISVGKIQLIEQVIENVETYTPEDMEYLSGQTIYSLLQMLEGAATDAAKETIEQTEHTAQEAVEQTANTMQEAVEETTNIAQEIVEQTTDTAKDIVEQTTDTALDIVDTTSDTINEMISDTVEEAWSGILDVFGGKNTQ